MESDEEVDENGALPPRQTWYPARRRLWITVFSVGSVLMAVTFVVGKTVGRGDSHADLIFLVYAVLGAAAAWIHSTRHFRADASGLHEVTALRTMTHRWEDIAQVRPSMLKGKRTFLILVRRDGTVIDLPLTEEHLDALRRWHRAAT